MRSIFISALSLSVAGCVSVTTAGTEEAVLFSGRDAGSETAQTALKPHNDLPLSIEFACPDKIATMSTFFVFPLPPVMPVGFVNKHVSYLRIKLPQDAEYAVARARIITPQGTALPLSDVPQPTRVAAGAENVELTYTLNNDCEDYDGGRLEVDGFTYKNRNYPASSARLQFDSKIRHSVAWSATGLMNGGNALTGGFDAMRTPEH